MAAPTRVKRRLFLPVLVSVFVVVAGCAPSTEVAERKPAAHSVVQALPSSDDRPVRLRIPELGVDGGLQPVGLLAGGAMETPPFGKIGWYDEGPPPGAPGPAVIVAHVHGPRGNDVFAHLHELHRGDRIRLDTTGGTVVFRVDATVLVKKESLPYDRLWPKTHRRLLSLITCGGTPTAAGYPDNTIVFAHALS